MIGAAWDEVDFEDRVWTIPASRSKNGFAHRVPLTKAALKILDEIKALEYPGEWLFPSPRGSTPSIIAGSVNKALLRSLGVMGLDNITPHDLRRTGASRMAEAGVARLVISKVLNHVSADRHVTAVYDRHSYDIEKRKALQIWEKRLKEILGS